MFSNSLFVTWQIWSFLLSFYRILWCSSNMQILVAYIYIIKMNSDDIISYQISGIRPGPYHAPSTFENVRTPLDMSAECCLCKRVGYSLFFHLPGEITQFIHMASYGIIPRGKPFMMRKCAKIFKTIIQKNGCHVLPFTSLASCLSWISTLWISCSRPRPSLPPDAEVVDAWVILKNPSPGHGCAKCVTGDLCLPMHWCDCCMVGVIHCNQLPSLVASRNSSPP